MSSIGRPPEFETPEELLAAGEKYFVSCKQEGTTPTICELAYSLGFESRQSFYDYEKRDAFSYAVKRLRLFLEGLHEAALDKSNYGGHIFWLKNNGWFDCQSVALSTPDGPVRIDPGRDRLTDEQLSTLITLAEAAKK